MSRDVFIVTYEIELAYYEIDSVWTDRVRAEERARQVFDGPHGDDVQVRVQPLDTVTSGEPEVVFELEAPLPDFTGPV